MGLNVEQQLRRAQGQAVAGQTDAAEATYRGILTRYPGNRRARAGLAALHPAGGMTDRAAGVAQLRRLLASGDHARAADLAAQLTTASPESADLAKMQGVALANLGRHAAALAAFKRAVTIGPEDAEVWRNMAVELRALGETETAKLVIGKAIQLRPDYADAHLTLALVLRAEGRHEAALGCLMQALTCDPDALAARLQLGQTLIDLGQLEKAEAAFRAAVRAAPASAEALAGLGLALAQLCRWEPAVGALEQALAKAPDNLDARLVLAGVLRRQGNFPAALDQMDRVLAAAPGHSVARVARATVLMNLGRIDAAITALRQTIAEQPDNVPAHVNLGNVLVAQGDTTAAIAALSRAEALNPGGGDALYNLASLVPVADLTTLTPKIETAWEAAQSGPVGERAMLAFAMATADLRQGNDARGVAMLDAGGRLRKAEICYDFENDRRGFARIRGCFPAEPGAAAACRAAMTGQGTRPVFVVGMPRSGTSLIEQILASHSAVHGAGELEEMRLLIQRAAALDGPLTGPRALAIRQGYLAAIAALPGAGESHVIDKMPMNFCWLGHILTALPEAVVIHVRRAPEAVCWSNFKLFFPADGMSFSYDQVDVARFWKLYRDLMAFWHETFPGRILDVDYEALTEDPEAESRRMVAAMDLPWQDGVLEFHQNDRAVRTASALQVRRKIYKGSSADWQRYADHLGPMLAELRRP